MDDALLRIKEQLPHGAWTPALKERDISKSTAHRFIQLRQKYPEMSNEVERAAPTARQHSPAYLVSADDLWDWERGEVSTLARRLLSEEELQKFSDNVTGEIRILAKSFKSSELLPASLHMMRRQACHVNIGPLQDAIAKTKRRLAILSESVGELIEKSTQRKIFPGPPKLAILDRSSRGMTLRTGARRKWPCSCLPACRVSLLLSVCLS